AHERTLSVLLERGREERPQLPEDDREREREPDPDADHHRGQEGLGHAERGWLELVRERPVQPVDDPDVEGEGDREAGDQRDQADDQACAELAEVLDKRRLLAVAQAPREASHATPRSWSRPRWSRRSE